MDLISSYKIDLNSSPLQHNNFQVLIIEDKVGRRIFPSVVAYKDDGGIILLTSQF